MPQSLKALGQYHGPVPPIHPETARHWSSLKEGRLELQRCTSCREVRFPLAPMCWLCSSPAWEWVEVDGDGTVSSAIIIHRALGDQAWASEIPFTVALVDLACGVRLPGRVVGEGDVGRGAAVKAGFFETDGFGVLGFEMVA